jgi:predicted phosphohydrolase
MRRLAWLTDIHLNFAEPRAIDSLFRDVLDHEVDAVLIGGDIGEAPDVEEYLGQLHDRLGLPIYFVLGNHDYYRGSVAGVRARIRELCARTPNLHWLPDSGVVELSPATALVGHDGWADGRLGSYEWSDVFLNDYWLIEDLSAMSPAERLERLHALGDEAAAHLRAVLPDAAGRFRHVLVLTHVPPYREACWHRGQISNDDYLPHFACKAVGEVLSGVAAAHPECALTALCGHTHSPGEAVILPNLRVLTGGAEYGRPEITRVLDIE